ncbi:hypothetical protein, partial [Pseudomonas sp. 2995-3]|uniref:hypothetical protein n=1 Tax=Pseudomonas sp. 2995-3 TaxID=1712680 RepID=UPI001C473D30
YEGEDGKVTVYTDLPEDFPADIPIPDDINPVGNLITEFEDDTISGYSLTFRVESDRREEVLSLYQNYLESNNYTIKEQNEMGGEFEVEAEKG